MNEQVEKGEQQRGVADHLRAAIGEAVNALLQGRAPCGNCGEKGHITWKAQTGFACGACGATDKRE